jgi:serpin B
MKPTIALLLILLAGCSLLESQGPTTRPDDKPTVAPSTSADFATRLHQKLADADQNLIFSPFSIQVALAMCAAGANGETRDVLSDLIGAPRNVDEQNHQYAALLKSVKNGKDKPFELVTANALWGHRGYRFQPEYKKTLANFYNGAFEEVDFVGQPAEAVKSINTWASDRTHARIKELVARADINQDTRLILTNAIYFKGKWEKQFKQADTKNEEWYGPSRKSKVPMMHLTDGFLYYENSEFQALDVPYKGGQLSLLVVLPQKKDGLKGLEVKHMASHVAIASAPVSPPGPVLSEGIYQEITDHLKHEERVIVSLPRFKTEATFRLKPVLCSLGAGLAFSNDADFTGIGDERLKISEVIHKAFVEVNEEGTEAAAATAVEMTFCTCPAHMSVPPAKIFNADHPFLFFIRDRNTNTVLFAGRVVDPM